MNGPILLVGGTGLLGSSLAPVLQRMGHEVLIHGRSGGDVQGDLSDQHGSQAIFRQVAPAVIINCAALADVDACQRDPAQAWRHNVLPARHCAAWCQNQGARLLQISTDQVYDGPGPHSEGVVSPRNAYAWSKLAAEEAALSANGLVLRTNFFGPSQCSGRQSFSDWVLTRVRTGQQLTVFTDVWVSPLRMTTLARMIVHCLQQWHSGLYNLGSREGMSKAMIAETLIKYFAVGKAEIRHGLLTEAGLFAPRPLDMRMAVTAFESTFALSLPSLAEEIAGLRDA